MRYLPHTEEEIQQMLQIVGVKNIDELFSSIPDSLRLKRSLNLPASLSEIELRNHLRDISRKNAHGEEWTSFLGGGSYRHYIPSAVSYLLSRGEFLTTYTPYQPEISQGTLQAIYEYQTMMTEILGMEIANASHYDGSTSAAEAVRVTLDVTGKTRVLVSETLHPEYAEVLKLYLRNEKVTVEKIPYTAEGTLDRTVLEKKYGSDVACLIVGYPNVFGIIEDFSDVSDHLHKDGSLLITSTPEPLALGLFLSPGEMGADIATAEGQSFGNLMSFGGPSLGIFAAKKQFARAIPGRLVGETVDTEGQRGFVLTLATREQHIRRERASSNICTNVSLCALAAVITLSLWGRIGFQKLAQINFDRAENLKEKLRDVPGIRLPFSGTTFNEFVIQTETPVTEKLLTEKIMPGVALQKWFPALRNSLSVCVTEMNSDEEAEKLVHALRKAL